uniref:Uncharacterized protein n=1 Tax=Nelumbo nucifera TaxID=4432 RepID=A0A822XWY3_NELNU|nr:TPA_asm: hypothetical protein HUJ06_024989 [Nelumbo nucifera]
MDNGDEATQIRILLKELKDMAKRAIDNNESSHTDFTTLVNELMLHRDQES